MDLTEAVRGRLDPTPRTIVFPEGHDPTIQDATVALARGGRVRPLLLGAPPGMAARLAPHLPDAEQCVITDCAADPRFGRLAQAYAARTAAPLAAAEVLLARPLFFAASLVAEGDAHGLVAGIDCPTEDVIVASHLALGPAEAMSAPCSFYLLDLPGRSSPEGSLLAFCDPAMNPRPDATQLAAMAEAAASAVSEMLGWEPRVALLSFSTHGISDDPAVEVVRDACAVLRARQVPFAFDGELQADAALDERVARRKLGDSAVAGRANVLVCPNLDAANIGAKLLLHFTGATAYGPFLLGFAGPVSDLSRGARLDDVVGTALLVAAWRPTTGRR